MCHVKGKANNEIIFDNDNKNIQITQTTNDI